MLSATLTIANIAGCTACTDLPLGPRPITQLSPKARILIASQAPGRIAHMSGVPFQDPSGRNLRRWLGMEEAAFYDPDILAILPMGFCYPGKQGGGDAPPRPLCAATWRDLGLAYLQSIELILIIGRHSLAWHLPHLKSQAITTLARQQIDVTHPRARLPVATRQAFVLPHPSPRTTPWRKANPWFEAEMVPRLRRAVASVMAAQDVKRKSPMAETRLIA
ncbi:MAG: uracil-DNA glycosylase family protein [Pseudomonadota bacterium]